MVKNIFLVEDDNDDIFLLKEALMSINEQIILNYAVNGEDALNALKSMRSLPDIVFLDLNMPCMNGFEFMVSIKNDKRLSELPIVIFTGSSNPEDAEKIHQLGAKVFLSKPSDPGLLRSKLQRILNFDLKAEKEDQMIQYSI